LAGLTARHAISGDARFAVLGHAEFAKQYETQCERPPKIKKYRLMPTYLVAGLIVEIRQGGKG
jgi:hypothetical protein